MYFQIFQGKNRGSYMKESYVGPKRVLKNTLTLHNHIHQAKNIMNIPFAFSKKIIEIIRSFKIYPLLRNKDILKLGIKCIFIYYRSKFCKK